LLSLIKFCHIHFENIYLPCICRTVHAGKPQVVTLYGHLSTRHLQRQMLPLSATICTTWWTLIFCEWTLFNPNQLVLALTHNHLLISNNVSFWDHYVLHLLYVSCPYVQLQALAIFSFKVPLRTKRWSGHSTTNPCLT